jgi:GNAT superfamily N-acetyltransferase
LTCRPYQPSDRDACLALFDANCPRFFAPNERADYLAFLSTAAGAYTICSADGAVAGGYGVEAAEAGAAALRWILLSPHLHGRGLGTMIMARVMGEVRALGAARLHIAASDKSAPFFARFGAREVRTIPDGWGPAMHRVDMLLAVDGGDQRTQPAG